MVLPLDTAPGPSPDEESVRNMEISHNFLRQAREELALGDLLQAASKAWGAAAYAIKAVAEKRRWFNDADWRLKETAWVISAEQGDEDIMMGFLAARQAHYDFYHHEEDAYNIERIIVASERLVGKLEAILTDDTLPPWVSEQVAAKITRLQSPTSAMDAERLSSGRKSMSDRPPAVPPELWTVPRAMELPAADSRLLSGAAYPAASTWSACCTKQVFSSCGHDDY